MRPYEVIERQADGSYEAVSTWANESDAEKDLAVWMRKHPLRRYGIVISDIVRKETWSDFYGCKAVICVSDEGKANLAVRTERGALVHAKTYNSYRGARIAMGKMSDCWRKEA